MDKCFGKERACSACGKAPVMMIFCCCGHGKVFPLCLECYPRDLRKKHEAYFDHYPCPCDEVIQDPSNGKEESHT